MYELPAHVYGVAEAAYRSMKIQQLDQCILITGESGSGKTEASKTVMQYISSVSVSKNGSSKVEMIKDKLLQSNPILEAFGNAKTHRNDNSSRFGKYMDIAFGFDGQPVGGEILNYLLEKSRVTYQNSKECNFHVFYFLLYGAGDEKLQELGLEPDSEKYSLLANADQKHFKNINSEEKWTEIMTAFSTLGVDKNEVNFVIKTIAAILLLGNIQFIEKSDESCKVSSPEDLKFIAELIEIDFKILEDSLTKRTLHARGEHITVYFTKDDALQTKLSFCKALYSKMFDWLVRRINKALKISSAEQHHVIGVLDIYGFEVMDRNGFEQMLINYCNEKLQQIFIELTLKSEQEEYLREGIEWVHIDFFNNKPIVNLIESKTGILALLDEECLRPGETGDLKLLNKFNIHLKENNYYESRQRNGIKDSRSIMEDEFRIQHYAGKVTYKIDGFVEKNRDQLYSSLSAAAYSSKIKMIRDCFPEGCVKFGTHKRPETAGYQFKQSMASLMKNLLSKSPNYIRCIKPNEAKSSIVFDSKTVQNQVRYLGLLENVRVRRAGFAHRQKYFDFARRYKMLSPETWPNSAHSAKESTKIILEEFKISGKEVAFGTSKDRFKYKFYY